MIIGICGGTGSGKTTIARKLIETIGESEIVLIEQDSYYRNLEEIPLDERHEANFDHPAAFETSLLIEHIEALRSGNQIERPIYDYATHTRKEETVHIDPTPVVILEGILIFAEAKLRRLCDIRIFVDTPDDVRLSRRLRRDINERGRTMDSVLKQYYKSVRPMHFQYVEPSKKYADVIIPEGAKIDVAIELLGSKVREELNNRRSAGSIS